ncbi:MAG: TIGR02452 family protein [Methylococcaceae bacterium]
MSHETTPHEHSFLYQPCIDSEKIGLQRRKQLNIPDETALEIALETWESIQTGFYLSSTTEQRVDWQSAVEAARLNKISIAPDAPLPERPTRRFEQTLVQIANESSLMAAHRLYKQGQKPLVLSFADGEEPGGYFLEFRGSQEQALCRSSALYVTLKGDDMYEAHRNRSLPDATDWAIYSPDVPVFRDDKGKKLEEPYPVTFISCVAPYVPSVGQPESGNLLEQRIHRILDIAHAYGHTALVLGAWGCGNFENDVYRTAVDFRMALEGPYSLCFEEVIFAIVDWTPARNILGPFRKVFSLGKPHS